MGAGAGTGTGPGGGAGAGSRADVKTLSLVKGREHFCFRYEVGQEVLDAFAGLDGVAEGRMLSLRGVAEAKLRAAGVERIEHVDLCTSCRPDLFFSHRRDGGVTGRQAGVVWRD